ncbi:hypothetical protein HNQ94_001766 [Salirhabdus euzebyi]|uniref:DUF192 domain-containing protein n=1 Tax=Salirhabdus euzebyi TaxID=394506 RepID=A0A841Q4J8_9BACI|nr:DUF192 domain-containing protein [Salirhabdus euzebyi]MBB6453318.1 hypothetical protein [Salirhabdus euzebyi]
MINNQLQTQLRIDIADTFFKRVRGLMFKKELVGEGLHIEPCNSIHMCFMKFPIDVVMLDKNKEVVFIKADVKPWRIIPPVKEAYSTLELPVGSIQKYKIDKGQRLNFM